MKLQKLENVNVIVDNINSKVKRESKIDKLLHSSDYVEVISLFVILLTHIAIGCNATDEEEKSVIMDLINNDIESINNAKSKNYYLQIHDVDIEKYVNCMSKDAYYYIMELRNALLDTLRSDDNEPNFILEVMKSDGIVSTYVDTKPKKDFIDKITSKYEQVTHRDSKPVKDDKISISKNTLYSVIKYATIGISVGVLSILIYRGITKK